MADLKEVLRLVNSARRSLGKRPLKKMPKGERGDDKSCPVAIGIGETVGESYLGPTTIQ